ncbi:MtN3 and saliva related transmembrane protein [Flavobacterium longum]|uniref:SemiSWEET family sugar transporter n=1 Tax=Flavobacterium longum TaxID=1299340 RepID=UPI0039ECAC6B
MDVVSIIGFAAAILTTAANLPQAVKIIRTRSVKDISSLTYTLLLAGLLLWTYYGIEKGDWPLIVCNGISALVAGTILAMKLLIKKQEDQN